MLQIQSCILEDIILCHNFSHIFPECFLFIVLLFDVLDIELVTMGSHGEYTPTDDPFALIHLH